MPPSDYKITLEQVEDPSAKQLTTELTKLTANVKALERVLQKLTAKSREEISIPELDKTAQKMDELQRKLGNLDSTIAQLRSLEKIPAALEKYIAKSEGVRKSAGEQELAGAIRDLVNIYKSAAFSPKYERSRADITNRVEKLLSMLLDQDKKSSQEIAKTLRELQQATGVAPFGKKYIPQPPEFDVKLFSKVLKDMGTEFEKIKKELGEKIVVAVDLETSAAKSKAIAKELGKNAATEFITQIAYQKGTLADIMAGTAKKGEIFVKPPAATEKEYLEKLVKDAPTEEVKKKIKAGAVAFDKLQKEGVDATEAMQKVAEVLKDAEAVIGHNVAKFDISVLEQHFEKAGVKVESAIDKFVDTVELSRKAFPERLSFPTRGQPYSLESFEKDFKLISKNSEEFSGKLHDASYDLELTAKVLKALDGSVEEMTAAQHDFAQRLTDISSKMMDDASKAFDSMAKSAKTLEQAVSKVDMMTQQTADAMSKADRLGKSFEKAAIEIEDLSKVRSKLEAAIIRPTVVRPMAPGEPLPEVTGRKAESPYKAEKLSYLVGDLAKSLNKLQTNIITSLEKGMQRGAKILKDETGEAFRLAPGKAEWELKIVDVAGLRDVLASQFKQFVSPEATPKDILETYKQAFVRQEQSMMRSPEAMADAVYNEIGGLTKEVAQTMGKNVERIFRGIKEEGLTAAEIAQMPELNQLFKEVALSARAERQLMDKYVKRIAIPAAQIGAGGGLTFQTKYGAQRSLANFATVTTGLEKLAKEMKALGAPAMEFESLMNAVTKAPLRVEPGTVAEAETSKLAATLIKRVQELGGRETVQRGYQRALALRRVERGELKPEAVSDYISTETQRPLAELKSIAKELGVTSLDVAKALDEISFENVYDVLDKALQAGKVPFLEKQARNIVKFDDNMRQVSKTINDLLGLLPMMETAMPKRQLYDEQALKVLTKPLGRLKPEEQKQHIIDVNMLWKDILTRSEKLGEQLSPEKAYLGRPMALSLDLSDASSSKLKQFNEDMVTNLKALDKTMTGMSVADLRGTVPFKEFSSISRQMSYITSALAGGVVGAGPGGGFEAPALISGRERRIIESGRYGEARTGLNVLTELRNTAQTFEDQIVISGRLAKAFTQVVSRLVKPTQRYIEGRITEIEPGVQAVTPRGARMRAAETEAEYKKVLSGVADSFQEILGVPQRYRGRADVAEIGDEIERVMREHRGKTIEVQTAKMTETFLNYFGRKLSTRFGTKGVSVTPRYGELPEEITSMEDVAKFIQEGFKAGVTPGPGLGVAKIPKTVGQMVSELISDQLGSMHTEKAPKVLHDKLIESGNKFIIEMFRDAAAGLVTEQEAEEQAQLFKDVNEAWINAFEKALPTGPEGIKEIRDMYTQQLGREPFVARPIEARISSRGIAKRGLMPEVLEGIINNLIGTTKGTTTLADQIGKGALTDTEEARKRLNEYLEALGYLGQTQEEINKAIERLETEKPGMDPEVIENLKNFESQWKVYTEAVNEFGERVKSFVAPKFLQIIEEPHQYPEWSEEQLRKGLKGARLDFQSFAAMAGVFGEGSSMMKELAASTALTAQEGWELLRTFQMLDPTMKDLQDTMTRGLQTFSLRDVRAFEKSTGTIEELKGTIFDIGKFPTPFKLKIPTTEKGAEKFYEEMYIPGAALRATYGEELLGTQAPTNVARYLDNLVDSAKKVETLAEAARAGGLGLTEDFQEKFASTIRQELVKNLTELIKKFQSMEKAPTPQNIAFMESTIKKYIEALSPTRQIENIWQEAGEITERGAVAAFARTRRPDDPERFSKIMGRIADVMVGPDPESLKREMERLTGALKAFSESGGTTIPAEFKSPYYQKILGSERFQGDFKKMIESFMGRTRRRGEARTVFDVELESRNLDEFTSKLGLNIQETVEEALERAKENLSKAKVRYFEALGEEVFGKKKGIEEVFFQRVTPAITGKAVSAIADKTEDLRNLLEGLKQEYVVDLDIPGLPDMIEDIEKLSKSHEEYVTKARKLGLPVLREGEIGLPPGMAEKIKVKTGPMNEIQTTLADLIKEQGEAFVESIRYPFTGTLSVQPHKAKLLTQGLGRHAIAVPGAPGFARAEAPGERRDITDLTRIVGSLREFVGVAEPGKYLPEETTTLLQRRETAWAEGTEEGAKKAEKLTKAIEHLLKVINDAVPSFVNLEQKLDFDGDALFVHTGALQESRQEISKHYEALGSDVTDVRTLFRSVFTAVKESDVSTLAEMAKIFSKKHPAEKGFGFLTKPYVTEQMQNLSMPEVMQALFTYTPAAKGMEPNTDEWRKSLQEWSRKTIAGTLDDVFERLAVAPDIQKEFKAKAAATEYGLPETEETTSQLETNIRNLAEELVRRQLWEKKYSDAITGQLYKLHTGQTVEGISRIARISELETGFGTGLAGTGKEAQPPAQEFLARWPKSSAALGGRPVEEFATRVNEIMRFVIQKGMDVKHAGVEAVGQQIIANIGRKGGTEFIREAMMASKDQWDELMDFNEEISNEIRLRLGKLSTEELKRELGKFEDIDMAALTLSREEIMERIIGHVDVVATFEELGRQIQRQAVVGLSRQLERQLTEMPAGPSKVKLMRQVETAGGVERFAEQKIAQEFASETGIAIQKYITSNLQPLYKMRTSMETLSTAAARTGIKIDPTTMALPEEGGERFRQTMEDVQKAAHVLSTAMSETGTVKGGGIHRYMVLTALQQRYKELEELQKLEKESQGFAGRMALPFTDIIEANKLAVKVFKEAGEESGFAGGMGPIPKTENLEEFFSNLKEFQMNVKERVSEISKIAGLMPMIPEEEALIGAETVEKYGVKPFETIKGVLEREALAKGEQIVPEDLEERANEFAKEALKAISFQAAMVEQLRRVTEIMKTVPAQKAYLERSFPEINLKEGMAKVQDAQKDAAQRHQDYTEALEEWHKQQFPTARTTEIKEEVKTFTVPAATTVAAEDLQKTTVEVADELTTAIDKSLVERKRKALKYLESKAAGPQPEKEVPLRDIYRASAVHGGGMYGGGPQLEAIVSELLGVPKEAEFLLEATGLRGTAIHRRKQKEFLEKYPTAEIEKPVEDFENKITGHIDVLYEEAGQKIVADIKTVYSTAQFERLEQISEEIKKRNITIQEKLDELKKAKPTDYVEKNVIRRLEDYISQVNVYLKGVEGSLGELVIVSTFDPDREVKIPIGAFDPARFQKDLATVSEAKSRVNKALETLRITGAVPKDLFADMPKVYKYIEDSLKEMSAEEFERKLPTRSIGEVQRSSKEIMDALTAEQEKRFQRLSREYLDIYDMTGERGLRTLFAKGAPGAGAPPAGTPPTPPGGAGSGGFDDDGEEELRKRVQEILARMERGIKPEAPEIYKLIQALDEAIERADAARADDRENLAAALDSLVETIRASIEGIGSSEEAYREIYDLLRKVDDIKRAGPEKMAFRRAGEPTIARGAPDEPLSKHINLRALYERAVRMHRLAVPEEMGRYGPEIAGLLEEAQTQGPYGDISARISEAIGRLPEGERGVGMRRVWMHYKKSVSEYFLKRLDDLREEIQRESGTAEGRRAYLEYEQVLENFLSNIRNTIGRMSDIFTMKGPSGKKTQWVDEELARLVGVYKSPKQIEEFVKQTTPMRGEMKPIMDMLVGDLDVTQLDQIAPPIEKVQKAFRMLTDEDKDMKAILADSELFARMGDQAVEAWDFEKLTKGITELRAALQSYNQLQIGKFGGISDYTEPIRKNVEDTIKYLKQMEQMFAPTGGKGFIPGAVGVPPFLGAETQRLLHRRNVAQVRQLFETPEEAGGPARGQAFTYRYKIVDPATKQTVENMAVEFRKLGEAATSTGKDIGVFSEKWEDMIRNFQSRRGIGQAFGRVIRWGLASRTVYGLVGALQNMVNTIADVESGIAVLRQVMSPLETDFEQVQQAALDFAKNFGLPIRQVIDAMRVFAQQGLEQQEVIDRTRTSLLAANVTTLNAADATEAVTAAMKVYGREGESTIRFLDSWTEVEARHAITSADLANALKKAAAVAKTSGVTFDELNAIITGIGETSRQTGKEIGTSLRFMFRRMQAEKGPKELGKIGIPVLAPTGELRRGFDILNDLAMGWNDLTSAQRLSIAQSIGGRRHYNSLIILMDHWNDTLETLTHSINSKGAAERRNAIVMETYAKQLQQVRAAVNELQVQFGKAFLPIAKTVLQTTKFLVEAFTNIPSAIKGAIVGFSALFVLMTKGTGLIQRFMDMFTTGRNVFGDFFGELKNEVQKGIFEVTGKEIGGAQTTGLKTFTEAKGVRDMETFLGKLVFMSAKAGRSWNAFLSDLSKGTSTTANKVARGLDFIGDQLFNISEFAATKGGIGGAVVAALSGTLGTATELAETGFEKVGKAFGFTAEQMALLTRESTGVVGALGPMVGSFFALKPLLGKVYTEFRRLTVSAGDYEKSVDGIRRKTSGELSDIKSLGSEYDKLNRRLEQLNKMREPEVQARAIEREEYEDPLIGMGKLYGDATEFANKLADANISVVSSFDKFGNAVLKSTKDLDSYVETLSQAKVAEMLGTELDVLSKYVEGLTQTTGIETFKREFKTLIGEIPVIGDIIAKSIKVAPAKELDVLTKKMNELLELRSRFPLTTTFDVDVEGLKKQLAEAREAYKATYDDFKRILAELPMEGLSPAQVAEALTRPEFEKGFEAVVNFEPRLQVPGVKGKITPEDILGIEVMKKIYPEIPLDFTKELTKGLLMQRNVIQREGEAFAGDIVMFTEGVADKYQIAGNQAILNMKETTEGLIEWTVQYFDKELQTVKEIPYSSVEKFVDSVFPVRAMQERLEGNIDVLQEFVAGAEAGLRGIGQKEFKQEFGLGASGLGARFFSGVPMTTLLQTTKGFEPGTGFGEIPFKQNWDKWIQDNFVKPMTEYRLLLEQVSKMQIETGEALMSPGLRQEIEKLQGVLKNNQVVLQYRAAHEDLMKTLSESQRVLKENIAAERNRMEFLVQSSGYLKGFASDFSDITTGVQKFAELTAQQRLAFRERGAAPENRAFMGLRQSFREDAMTRESLVSQLNELDKTLIAIKEITDIAEAFGAALPTEELVNYTEEIAKTGERGTGLLLAETKNVTTNTAETVDRLDQLLERGGDEKALERLMAKVPEMSPGKLVDRMEDLAERRREAADDQNVDLVASFDRAIDAMTNRLIEEVGVEKALKMVTKNKPLFFGTQEFTPTEFIQRALGNIDYSGFEKAVERVEPGLTQTGAFKELADLQKEQNQAQIVSNKTLTQLLAAYSAFEHFNKTASNKQLNLLDMQIQEMTAQRQEMEAEGVDEQMIGELTKRIEELTQKREAVAEVASGQARREWIAPVAIGMQEFAKSLGMTEKEIRMLGGSAAATYAAFKLWSKLSEQPVPENIEKMGAESEEAIRRMTEPGVKGQAWKGWYFLKDLIYGKESANKLEEIKSILREQTNEMKSGKAKGGEKAEGMQTGGMVTGPGGPKSDNILKALSPGEYVLKADAVKKLGKNNLDALNFGPTSDQDPMNLFSEDIRKVYERLMRASKVYQSGGIVAPTPIDPMEELKKDKTGARELILELLEKALKWPNAKQAGGIIDPKSYKDELFDKYVKHIQDPNLTQMDPFANLPKISGIDALKDMLPEGKKTDALLNILERMHEGPFKMQAGGFAPSPVKIDDLYKRGQLIEGVQQILEKRGVMRDKIGEVLKQIPETGPLHGRSFLLNAPPFGSPKEAFERASDLNKLYGNLSQLVGIEESMGIMKTLPKMQVGGIAKTASKYGLRHLGKAFGSVPYIGWALLAGSFALEAYDMYKEFTKEEEPSPNEKIQREKFKKSLDKLKPKKGSEQLAYVSPGEYIFNKETTSGLGKETLDHMNKYGEIPAFQEGGGVGDIPSKPLMDKFRSAMEAARAAREERASGETEEQTDLLSKILDSTKRTAENTNDFNRAFHEEMKADRGTRRKEFNDLIRNVEALQGGGGIDTGPTADPIKKLVGILIAATAAGYVAERREDVGRFNELENRAERETELINKVIEDNQDAIVKAIEEFRSRVEVARVKPQVETETVQLAVDVKPFEEEMVKRLEDVRKQMENELDKLNESMSETADEIAKMELKEQMEMKLEQMEDAIRASKFVQEFENKFVRELSGVMAGLTPMRTALGERDITAIGARERLVKGARYEGIAGSIRRSSEREAQRAKDFWKNYVFKDFFEAGKEIKNIFHGITLDLFKDDLADINREFESMVTERDQLVATASEMNQELAQLEGKDLTSIEQERYELLEDSLEELEDRISGLNESIKETADTISKAVVAEEIRMDSVRAATQASITSAQAMAALEVTRGKGAAAGIPEIGAIPFGPMARRGITPEERAFIEEEGFGDQYKNFVAQQTEAESAMSRMNELIAREAELRTRMSEEMRTNNEVSEATKEEFKLIKEQLKNAKEAAKEANEELAELANTMYAAVEAARFQSEAESRRIEAFQQFASEFARGRFGAEVGGYLGKFGLGAGAVGEIPMGRTETEITASERAYALAIETRNRQLKESIELFRAINMQRNAEIESLAGGRSALVRYQEELDQAVEDDDASRIKAVSEAIDKQNESNRKLEDSIGQLTDKMRDLSEVQAAMTFAGLIQGFKQMEETFLSTETLERFRRLGEGFERLPGGRHPLAPVAPRYSFLQAGLAPEDIFNVNKYQAQLLEQRAAHKRITAEQVIQANAQRKLDMTEWGQLDEREKLLRQRSQAENMYMQLVKAQRKAQTIEEPKVREQTISNIEALRQDLESQYARAADVIGEPSAPGGARYRGFDFDKIMTGMYEAIGDIKFDPVLQEISESNTYLKQIVENTGGFSEKTEGKEEGPGLLRRIWNWWSDLVTFVSTEPKQKGGYVRGPGGPTSDSIFMKAQEGSFVLRSSAVKDLGLDNMRRFQKGGEVPIRVSNGEYIFGPDEVSRIGVKNLEHMNKTGKLPESAHRFVMDQLARGVPMSEIQKELGGLEIPPWYTNANTLTDIMAGSAAFKIMGISLKNTALPAWAYFAAKFGAGRAREAAVSEIAGRGMGTGPTGKKLRDIVSKYPGMAGDVSSYATKNIEEYIAEAGAAAFHRSKDTTPAVVGEFKKALGITYTMGGAVKDAMRFYQKGGEVKIPEGYMGVYKYFHTDDAEMPEYSKDIMEFLRKDVTSHFKGTPYELQASMLSYKLEEIKNWKDAYNAFIEAGEDISAYIDAMPAFKKDEKGRVRTLRHLTPKEIEDYFEGKGMGGKIIESYQKGGPIGGTIGDIKYWTEKDIVHATNLPQLKSLRRIAEYEERAKKEAMYAPYKGAYSDMPMPYMGTYSAFPKEPTPVSRMDTSAFAGFEEPDWYKDSFSAETGSEFGSMFPDIDFGDLWNKFFGKKQRRKFFDLLFAITDLPEEKDEYGQRYVNPIKWWKEVADKFIEERKVISSRDPKKIVEYYGGADTKAGKDFWGLETPSAWADPINYVGGAGAWIVTGTRTLGAGALQGYAIPEAEKYIRSEYGPTPGFEKRETPGSGGGGVSGYFAKTMPELVAETKRRGLRERELSEFLKMYFPDAQEEFIEHIAGQIAKEIGSFKTGTPYVSKDQLAFLHKGEAVIPSEYNVGGMVMDRPRFQAGGAVNALTNIADIGEQIGEAVAKRLEDTTVKLDTTEVKLDTEVVTLDTSDLEALLANNGLTTPNGVGADMDDKLDELSTKLDTELRRFDEKIVENTSKITDLTIEMQNAYTKPEQSVDMAEERSRLEAKLHEAITELRTNDLSPMRSQIFGLRSSINVNANDIANLNDLLDSLSARNNLR